jgi:hypothetical protein
MALVWVKLRIENPVVNPFSFDAFNAMQVHAQVFQQIYIVLYINTLFQFAGVAYLSWYLSKKCYFCKSFTGG